MKNFWAPSRNRFRLEMPAGKISLHFQLIRPGVRSIPPSYAAACHVSESLCIAMGRWRP